MWTFDPISGNQVPPTEKRYRGAKADNCTEKVGMENPRGYNQFPGIGAF